MLCPWLPLLGVDQSISLSSQSRQCARAKTVKVDIKTVNIGIKLSTSVSKLSKHRYETVDIGIKLSTSV